MDWGKPDYGSAAQKLKLKANNLKLLTGNTMKEERVFFLSDIDLSAYVGKSVSSNDRMTHFYYWLKENYGATGIQLVDKVCEGIYVYHFVFDHECKQIPTYDIQDYMVENLDAEI